MTCLGLHYTIFDTGGEDADHFTLTIRNERHSVGNDVLIVILCFYISYTLVLKKYHLLENLLTLSNVIKSKRCKRQKTLTSFFTL